MTTYPPNVLSDAFQNLLSGFKTPPRTDSLSLNIHFTQVDTTELKKAAADLETITEEFQVIYSMIADHIPALLAGHWQDAASLSFSQQLLSTGDQLNQIKLLYQQKASELKMLAAQYEKADFSVYDLMTRYQR